MAKVRSQTAFLYAQWKSLLGIDFWGRFEIQMSDSSLTKKATALFNMERMLSINRLLNKVLKSEFEKFGLAGNPEFESFRNLTQMEWSTVNFFGSGWEQMIQGFLTDFFEDLRNDFEIRRKKLKKKLSKISFSQIDGLLRYGLAFTRVKEFYDSKIALFYQDFQFGHKDHAIIDDMIRGMVREEHRKLNRINREFLLECFEYLDPVICRFLEYEDLVLYKGLFSKTTLKSFVRSLGESKFSFTIKDRIMKHFLDEIIYIKKLKRSQRKANTYDIHDFIGQSVYIFSILVRQNGQRKTAKVYLNEYFKIRPVYEFLIRLIFPFIKEELFFKLMCSRIMVDKYKLLSKQKCLVPFHAESEVRNRRYIESMKDIKDLSHEYLVTRSLSIESTLFISGYLSKDSQTTKDSWKKLEEFFPEGNLISVDWNSTSTDSVRQIFRNFGAESLASIFTFRKIAGLISIFGSAKNLYDRQKTLFMKTYNIALEEGRLSYKIMKRNQSENDRALNLVSFSLGTVYSYAFLKQAVADKSDPLIINDVFLMGGCLDQGRLEELLLYMLVEDSFFKGTIYVVHSHMDLVLRKLFKLAFSHLSPLGIEGFDHEKCCDTLMDRNVLLFDTSISQTSQDSPRKMMLKYLRKRIKNVDVTRIAGFHTMYRGKLKKIFTEIYSKCGIDI